MQKLRLTAVSYLNTKPFIYGIYRSALAARVSLSLDIPSVCAQKLASGEADLALAPVAIIPSLPEAHLVSSFCIGATGPVKTVCIFAEKPITELSAIYLDFHSKTSATLAPILCREYWKACPEFRPAFPGYEKQIGGDVGGLVIGDRAIGLETQFSYVYDFGEAWTAWTSLPFVFAAWISARPLSPDFVADFNQALQVGIDHLPELIQIIPTIPDIDLYAYYKQNISYELDDAKWQGLNHFLRMLPNGEKTPLQRGSAFSLTS